ncbi:hypothetical protein DT076_16560 [Desertihabitans brevis]|uniref:Uncharacterized protein n=1 Tax=Desertihabitans brevis TaxID=2268447 RepID=A0A367YR42_9ACTN|nr:hypothetical protein [Desertihabitans brevis]RCK68260.1 hypothetical protein DT076_16560 [Desertihabitans brevis]
MAIISNGYVGQIMQGDQLGRWHGWAAGRRYWCYSHAGGGRISVIPSGTREVEASPGYLGAYGIVDQITTDTPRQILQLPAPSSGSRHYMIVMRREWGSSAEQPGRSYLAFIDAGDGQVLPTRNTDYGTLDDQPLALYRVTFGESIPQLVADLRMVGTEGNLYARSELVLQYMEYPGARVRIGDDEWRYEPSYDFNGAGWHRYPFVEGREVPVNIAPNFTGASTFAHRQGQRVTLRGLIQSTRGNLNPGRRYFIGDLPTRFRPTGSNRRFYVPGWADRNTVPTWLLYVQADGDLYVDVVGPGRTADIYLDSVTFPVGD